MRYLKNKLIEAGIFNVVLIIVAMLLDVIALTYDVNSVLERVHSILNILALVAALFYAFNGYVKQSAKYYKLFALLYFVSSLLRVIIAFLATDVDATFNLVLGILQLICLAVLTFVKNLGKKNSYILSGIIILLSVLSFISIFLTFNTYVPFFIAIFNDLIFACIVFVFVCVKYNDKASRGAN